MLQSHLDPLILLYYMFHIRNWGHVLVLFNAGH